MRTTAIPARGANDAGLNKIPRSRQHFPAAQHFSALGLGRGDGRGIARNRARIDQGPHQGALLERVADWHLCVGGEQAPFEFCRTRAVHEHSPRGGATLTGCSDGTEDNRRYRQVQIGVLIDDQCVVAAQLQQALAEALCDAHADLSADMRGSRKGHQRHAPVIDESSREFGARIDEHLKYRRQLEPLQDSIADVLHGERAQ